MPLEKRMNSLILTVSGWIEPLNSFKDVFGIK